MFGFNKKQDLIDGEIYITGNMVFKVNGKYQYDINNIVSIPYYWLVDLILGKRYDNSTLGLPKGQIIRTPTKEEYNKAIEIYSDEEISFGNVKRLIIESKTTLDKALKMLIKLANEQQR